MTTEQARLSRLRTWIVVLMSVIVFAAFAAPISVIYFQRQTADRNTLAVICVSARANVSQLKALAALERRLGIPRDFDLPKVPAECDSLP